MDRYHRQMLLPEIGRTGQVRLGAARVLLVGCGALGSVIADQLVRAGVGELRIADRDIVELTNLQRQVLYTEDDVKAGRPKAVAAAERLAKVNSQVKVEPLPVDVHAGNIEDLAGVVRGQKVDLLLDGTDNVETRYLVNDVAVKHGISWVYGACVGWQGRVMAVRPDEGPCLRCVYPEPPPARELPTCDTAGVLGPAAGVVGALEAVAAIKLLSGSAGAVSGELLTLDLWTNRIRSIATERDPGCPCCGKRHFEFLTRPSADAVATLCGRDAVQVRPATTGTVELHAIGQRLIAHGEVEETRYFVRCTLRELPDLKLTVFPDGRLLVNGTRDPARARSIYARYVGV